MNAIWSLGQAMFTKVIVIVDHDVNVQDSREVVWKALCAIDPERDIQFVLGPVDTLDHAARRQDFGSKMGIDATRKWPEEGLFRTMAGRNKNGRGDKATRGCAVVPTQTDSRKKVNRAKFGVNGVNASAALPSPSGSPFSTNSSMF